MWPVPRTALARCPASAVRLGFFFKQCKTRQSVFPGWLFKHFWRCPSVVVAFRKHCKDQEMIYGPSITLTVEVYSWSPLYTTQLLHPFGNDMLKMVKSFCDKTAYFEFAGDTYNPKNSDYQTNVLEIFLCSFWEYCYNVRIRACKVQLSSRENNVHDTLEHI